MEKSAVRINSLCTGSVTVGGRKIKCWRHYRPHGTQEFKQAVQNSCNPVFVELGSRLGVGKCMII
ncbi:penicillin binding transpeptidase domain protein [Clostridioides difficile DA00165]|nr:penicillin binding transpeptidase domain protein [Clostridioides difficile DA00165]